MSTTILNFLEVVKYDNVSLIWLEFVGRKFDEIFDWSIFQT